MQNKLAKEEILKTIINTPTAWAILLIEHLENIKPKLAFSWCFSFIKNRVKRSRYFDVFDNYIQIMEKVVYETQTILPIKSMEYSREIFFLNESKDIFISDLSNFFACEAYYSGGHYELYKKHLNYIAMNLNFDKASNIFINIINEDCVYAVDTYIKLVD